MLFGRVLSQSQLSLPRTPLYSSWLGRVSDEDFSFVDIAGGIGQYTVEECQLQCGFGRSSCLL
jgi:hypothetical protein